MARTVRTFGDYLRHFARSVDIVDERTMDDIRQLVYNYVRDELAIGYFSLASEQTVDGKPGLRTIWSTSPNGHATTIRTPAGAYGSQISLSFDQRKPLWVVNLEQRPLRHTDDYVDLWSGVAELPKYQAPIDQDMKTSIVVPLTHWGRAIGVIYLESTSYLEITPVAKHELSLLADALSILFDLRQANRAQVQGTVDALTDLRAILSATSFPRLTKPQVFVAFSGSADEQVVGIMQEVLDDFTDSLSVVQWDRIEESGSITSQLVEQIARSRFGICYLSEPTGNGKVQFQDNPNVLFEAGMLHSLTNSPAERPSGWVPIRERRSPDTPFDFASERILFVPRSADGEVMEARFRSAMRKRVEALVSEAE
jgi:hypothetical protein